MRQPTANTAVKVNPIFGLRWTLHNNAPRRPLTSTFNDYSTNPNGRPLACNSPAVAYRPG